MTGNPVGQFYFSGRCMKSEEDIVYVCKRGADGKSLICQTIMFDDDFRNSQRMGSASTAIRMVPGATFQPFSIPDDVHCPGCGIRKGRWRYWRCATCETLHCFGGVKLTGRPGNEVHTFCTRCRKWGTISDSSPHMDSVTGTEVSKSAGSLNSSASRKLL